MSPLRIWLMAARPRTLPAAIAPVLVGSAAALHQIDATRDAYNSSPHILILLEPTSNYSDQFGLPQFGILGFLAALFGAIFIQIGTNLANDYSDAKRGADTADRLGPVRVTSAGLVAPKRVLYATWVAFGIAALFGIYLATVAGPEIVAVGVVSIAAGYLYTGGPRPYGYAGLGEVFVFLFFGLVAVNGSYYVQLDDLETLPILLSIGVGCLSTAILVVNNVRDLETDRRAGKATLAVKLGRLRTRTLYLGLVGLGFAMVPVGLWLGEGPAAGLLALLALPLAIKPAKAVLTRTDGPALNGALAGTGALLGAYSVLLSVGLLV